ncbi:MAG: zinc ABC transporter solute-binding protein [Acholeplasmataceae bacterium]|jgi:manganese/zinc/iron transport system substrate-binding protein|nr:zinc ABC transporter solute-binding protein [Acholeplasmataceae bacterium]
MKKKIILIFVTILSISLLVGCANPKKDYRNFLEAEEIKIVATTSLISDMVRNIGGNKVVVHQLMKPGVDPHSYIPTKLDIDYLLSAEVVIFSGMHLEAQTSEALRKVANRDVLVIEAANVLVQKHENNNEDGVTLLSWTGENHEGHNHGDLLYDPHFWFNVDYWIIVSRYITNELQRLYPQHENYFELRYQSYLVELNALNTYLESRISEVPVEKRVLLTAHDAFGYFGERYGFSVNAVLGVSTEDEASTKDIENLVSLAIEKNVEVVFIESSVPQKTINAIIESARIKNHTIRIGGELFSDALGNPDGKGSTYIDMLRDNIDMIVDAINNK